MKVKYFLLIFLILINTGGILAQNLRLVNLQNEKNVKLADVSEFVEVKAFVKNVSSSPLNVKVMEIGRNVASDKVRINYCWAGLCLPSVKDVESEAEQIAANAESELKVDVYPENTVGLNQVTYRVFPVGSIEALDVTFKVNITTGSTSITRSINNATGATLSQPYPNPSSSISTINYHIPGNYKKAFLVVFDIFGKEIARLELERPSDAISLNVKKFNPGLYFCCLEVDNKVVSSQRLLVN
ncbi:MAG: T9SS type A sorting domain-containing protein [Bacteroidia bacterium]|nr:T9SS type A sorting domain-containing protein [Bacteroidia bacterium]MDW8158237.1 T9SS type A sorting domain-containing protein [Bacteroidia bacterium]